MIVWLFYDIRKNKIRALVARCCKQCGLRRMQKSVFAGTIRKGALTKLQAEIKRLIHPTTDVVHIQPIGQPEFRKLLRFGRQADVPTVRQNGQVNFY